MSMVETQRKGIGYRQELVATVHERSSVKQGSCTAGSREMKESRLSSELCRSIVIESMPCKIKLGKDGKLHLRWEYNCACVS